MNKELELIDRLETVIDKLESGRIADGVDDLKFMRDETQKEVDEFEKWAEEESKKDDSQTDLFDDLSSKMQ